MSLLMLKPLLARMPISHVVVASDQLTFKNKKLMEMIITAQREVINVSVARKKSRNRIIMLRKLIGQIEFKKEKKAEMKAREDLITYEKNTRKLLFDYIRIIKTLRDLIKNEYLDILFDIRDPLVLFGLITEKGKGFIVKVHMGSAQKKELQTIIEEIANALNQLVDYLFKIIEEDFRYYQSIGLEFERFNQRDETEYALETYLEKRGAIKNKISGNIKRIQFQIKKLEEQTEDLHLLNSNNERETQTLLGFFRFFRKEFNNLLTFCTERADIANYIIIESIVMQMEYYEGIKNIKGELDKFYEDITGNNGNEKNKEMICFSKRVKIEFERFQHEFSHVIESVNKEGLRMLTEEMKPDLEIVNHELNYIKKHRIRNIFLSIMATLMISGYSSTSSSAIGTVRDSMVSLLTRPLSQIEVLQDLKGANVNEIQEKINETTMKISQGEALTKDDKNFIKNIYQAFVLGGMYNRFQISSQFLNNYINGTGKTVNLSAYNYTRLPIVAYAMEKMEAYLAAEFSKNKIRPTGIISSSDVLPKNHKLEGGWKGQGEIENGVLIPGTGTIEGKDMYYAVHKFYLKAAYEFKENKLAIRWSIDDRYDFEKSDKVTNFRLPGTDRMIVLSHLLGHSLVKHGLAREFDVHAEWVTQVTNFNALLH